MSRPEHGAVMVEIPLTRVPPINAAAFLCSTTTAGPGLRDVLWVQGCTVGCPGCGNPHFLSMRPRRQVEVSAVLRHLELRRSVIDGLTVSGGEPTEQPVAVTALLQGARDLGLSTVVFTGHTYEELQQRRECAELLAATDLLVDGPYLADQRDLDLPWRGSRNQRLLRLSDRFSAADLEPQEATGEIVLGEDGMTFAGIGGRRWLEDRRGRSTVAPEQATTSKRTQEGP